MQTNEKYVLLTTTTCPLCDKAKELLTFHNKSFVGLPADAHRDFLAACGLKTVPQVFVVDTGGWLVHVGGYRDLEALLS